ncbi:hypothetical protein Taro_038108 [Colocasia esculenta]|uniref:Uncharacterized protein n=1 Tax=Colocasia esculenta TaxID=4460 RepID=A0A843WL75_COLES|nr:hypothetical protein [Colocasia esculenta]
MDKAHRELEETKAAMEKLTADFCAKSELSDTLKRAYDEQCGKLQEAKMQIERQAHELSEKSEEISSAGQMLKDLRLCLHEKDSALKHLSATNDQLRASWGEKLTTLEGENKDLATALSEANARTEEQVQKISIYEGELEKLKHLLLESQKKCSDAERKAEAAKELKMREQVVMELEKENGKVLEQLKWKSEQFRHLEDAKEKLQDQFQSATKEWQMEKSSLVDEIFSLQKNLESKTRVADDLSSCLQMCNQALAHEQSRRKMLEIQISESKATYENVLTEYEEARLTINKLAAKRDDEIASLRNILATKDTLLKDSDYRKADLEQENQELHKSLKELQEAQINEAGAGASLKNVRQKLRSLEHAHRECPAILKDKEAKWRSQTKKLEVELNDCLSKLSCSAERLQELQAELEATQSSLLQLKWENQELSVMLFVLLSKYSEVQSEFGRMQDEMEVCISEKLGQISFLKEQIKSKSGVLDQAKAEIEEECGTRKTLLERVEYLEATEQKYVLVQKELNGYKEMLEKSSSHVNHLKSQAVQRESCIREELRNISNALNAANSALAEKEQELYLVNFELKQCKSAAQQLEKSKLDAEIEMKLYHNECQSTRKELESALLARMEAEKAIKQERGYLLQTMEEKERKIEDFRKQISQMEEDLANKKSQALAQAELEAEVAVRKEKERCLRIVEDKDKRLEGIQKEFDLLMHELSRAEIAAAVTLQEERIHLIQLSNEKEEEIVTLRKQIISLEGEFSKSLEAAIALELADKQLEVDTLYEAFKKTAQAYVLDVQELEFEKLVIRTLEDGFEGLNQELKVQEEVSFDLRKCVIELQSELEIERSERERERIQMKDDLQNMRHNEENLKDEIKEFKQLEVDTLYEAFEKTTQAYVLVVQGLEFEKLVIRTLEDGFEGLKQELKVQEEVSFDLKKCVIELQSELEVERSDRERERIQMKDDLQNMRHNEENLKDEIKEFKRNTGQLHDVVEQLSSERHEVVLQMTEIADLVTELTCTDDEIRQRWLRIAHKIEISKESKGEALSFSRTEGENNLSMRNKVRAIPDRREPLKEYNS